MKETLLCKIEYSISSVAGFTDLVNQFSLYQKIQFTNHSNQVYAAYCGKIELHHELAQDRKTMLSDFFLFRYVFNGALGSP